MDKLIDKIMVLSNSECPREIVEYGLEIMAGEGLCAILIMAIGLLTNHMIESLLYLFCLIPVTATMGGVSL